MQSDQETGRQSDECHVRFEPSGEAVSVDASTSLLEAANNAGVRISSPCGGRGVCGACRVLIKEGRTESSHSGKLSNADFAIGIRQACQSRAISDLVVEVLPTAQLDCARPTRETSPQTIGSALSATKPLEPMVSKVYVELPPPSLGDNASDLSRLLKGVQATGNLRPLDVSLEVIRELSTVLRASNWQLTTTLLQTHNQTRIIRVEPGDTRNINLSFAFDIGTTAVRGQLLDLAQGQVLAEAIDYNGQISYGADVISRILHCQNQGGLAKLQQAVVATINKLIQEMINRCGAELKHVNHILVAANTVMVHLLLSLDPQYLRLSPYVPTVSEVPLVLGRALGLDVPPHLYVSTMPSVASYVGGDVVSGIIGTGIYRQEKTTLYIDIGTNGEIVAGNRDWMVTAAASAGPTFEGGGIQCGMLATSGAIDGFEFGKETSEPIITTIGNERPRGICGSGLINIAAALLRSGFISQNGKFNQEKKSARLRSGADSWEYVLVQGSESQTGRDIVITEIDLDNLIRAKAAIFAGCQTLIKAIGSGFSNLDQVVIAGTFGTHMNIESAVAIGLLPDLPRERFIFTGNGSLLGARLCSFSAALFRDAEQVARLMTNIELSENADFMTNYVAALFLPHTNMRELFPSVKFESAP